MKKLKTATTLCHVVTTLIFRSKFKPDGGISGKSSSSHFGGKEIDNNVLT